MRMLRCVLRTWITPSNAQFRLWMIGGVRRTLMGRPRPHERVEGVWGNREIPPRHQRRGLVGETWFLPRERAAGERRSCDVSSLPALHLRPVVVAEEVQEAVNERPVPGRADDLWAEHDVAELTWYAGGELVAPVDRERQDVGRLVDPEMGALELAHTHRRLEDDPEVALGDVLRREHAAAELRHARLVDRRPAPVGDLDSYHRRRCVPVSSAWRLYASTMRWTSTWRTTSWLPNSTNSIPSISARMRWTWMSPDAWSCGRSTCVTSPVTTTLEPNPRRVR